MSKDEKKLSHTQLGMGGHTHTQTHTHIKSMHKQKSKTCKLIKERPAQKSMLLTMKWISATSHKQSSFITYSSARKNEGKKIRRGGLVRSTFIFWLMKRKLRQFPRLGNKRRRENARGAFKTTMHHNLQTEPWSLICSSTVIHPHQGCQLMLCSVSMCIFSEWQSRTDGWGACFIGELWVFMVGITMAGTTIFRHRENTQISRIKRMGKHHGWSSFIPE